MQKAKCKIHNVFALLSRFPTSDHDVLDHAEQVEGLDGMSRGLLSLSQAHAVPPVSHLEQGVHNWVHERVSLGDRDLEEFCPGEMSRAYLIFVIFFTQLKILENKIYTEKRQFFA